MADPPDLPSTSKPDTPKATVFETATSETLPAKPQNESDEYTGEAASKMFAIAELLEQTLLHLTTRELFGVRRTCKTFNETIEGSVKLQRAMFLQACPEGSYDLHRLQVNPLLDYMFLIPSPVRPYESDIIENSALDLSSTSARGSLQTVHIYMVLGADQGDHPSHWPSMSLNQSTEIHSWRRTNITQASPTAVEHVVSVYAPEWNESLESRDLGSKAVYNLGDIVDLTIDLHKMCVEKGYGSVGDISNRPEDESCSDISLSP